MGMSWTEIEARVGFAGVSRLVEGEIRPQLDALPPETLKKDGTPKGLGLIMGVAVGLFILAQILLTVVLPDNSFGGFVRFVLFIPLFFASFVASIYLFRRRLVAWILRSQTRYLARAKALGVIADHVGIKFIPRPGGEHPILDWVRKQSWLDADLKGAVEEMPGSDLSMAPAVEAARQARIMGRDPVVIGSAEQKAQIEDQALQMLDVEDGFQGTRGGVAFDALEWIERVDEAPNKHHLVIVLKAPSRFQGITELRARKLPWLVFRDQADMETVDLGPRAFNDRYRLRSSDQVEARALFDPAVMERLLAVAHGAPFRAVARGEHLVFAFEGADRFAIVDMQTGRWSDETLRQALTDLAETLDLVEAFAGIFRVRA